jgi:hypothetical protein
MKDVSLGTETELEPASHVSEANTGPGEVKRRLVAICSYRGALNRISRFKNLENESVEP